MQNNLCSMIKFFWLLVVFCCYCFLLYKTEQFGPLFGLGCFLSFNSSCCSRCILWAWTNNCPSTFLFIDIKNVSPVGWPKLMKNMAETWGQGSDKFVANQSEMLIIKQLVLFITLVFVTELQWFREWQLKALEVQRCIFFFLTRVKCIIWTLL